MNPKKLLFISSLFFFSFTSKSNFLAEQQKYERVRTAIKEKAAGISQKLKSKNINQSEFNILLVAYKAEEELKLYAKNKTDKNYQLLSEYKICANSGTLGPKRKQGDAQVPEGFYYIDRYNPVSNFYLSLGISYPNESDKRKSSSSNLGGDIFIHGSCVTIGCLPMTDDKIKEIYLYAVYARQAGQMKIPVYIFPFEMTEENLNSYKNKYSHLASFWNNLKLGYDKFQKSKSELSFSINKSGNYEFK